MKDKLSQIANTTASRARHAGGHVASKSAEVLRVAGVGARRRRGEKKEAEEGISDIGESSELEDEARVDFEPDQVLNLIYSKVLDGIPRVSRPVDKMVDDYLSHAETPEKAAIALSRAQVAKCGTSGFLSGLGGVITLPVAIPANIGSVLYVQMRLVAAIAKIGGYDIRSDQVQTLVYMCLTGTAVSDVIKQAGIKIGEKTLEAAIKRIPGAALVAINRKIGFRLLTKFGEKGAINLGKMIPLAGGVIGGAMDVASTTIIAKNAIKVFIEDENPDGSGLTDEEVLIVDSVELDDPLATYADYEEVVQLSACSDGQEKERAALSEEQEELLHKLECLVEAQILSEDEFELKKRLILKV